MAQRRQTDLPCCSPSQPGDGSAIYVAGFGIEEEIAIPEASFVSVNDRQGSVRANQGKVIRLTVILRNVMRQYKRLQRPGNGPELLRCWSDAHRWRNDSHQVWEVSSARLEKDR